GAGRGVGHEEIEAAQAASALVEGPAAVVGVADVELHRAAFPAAPLDLASDLERGARVASVADRDRRAAPAELQGGSAADAAGATGDERELAVEVTHARAPTTAVRMEPRARAQDLVGELGSLHVEEHQTIGQRDFGRAVRPLVRREHLDV